MPATNLSRRFLETTRGQIVALLRRSAHTVEELARTLGLTANAIRSHLSTLERDGLIQQTGVRRGAGAGKPAVLYEIHPEAEPLFSRAYAPVLGALLDELVAQLPEQGSDELMEAVGRRLAAELGRPPAGDLEARVRAGAALLDSLGGETSTDREDGALVIRGCGGCPLSATVSRRPELCRAVESLLSEFVGVPVRQRCEHGERPRCRFEVPSAA